MSWIVVEKLPGEKDRVRCDDCGAIQVGNRYQARYDKLRCYTCNPKANVLRGRAELRKKDKPPAPPPELTPLEGRMPQHPLGYSRAVRYSIEPPLEEDADAETQTGRIEIVGLRTRNPLNQRAHWTAIASAVKTSQKATLEAFRYIFGDELLLDGHDYSFEVKLTRLSPKMFPDDEAVVGAMKGVRDGFAIFARINDGNRRRIRFSYGVGKAPIQSAIIEWKRTVGPFDDDAEELVFFDLEEQHTVRREHKVTRGYWRERRARQKAADTFDAKMAVELDPEADDEPLDAV